MFGSRFSSTVVSLFFGSVATLGVALPASADTVQFRGTSTLSKFTSACAEYGWPTSGKAEGTARYRPPNLGDNDKSTRFAFFFSTYAASYKLEKGTISSSFKPVIGGATGSQTYFFENTPKLRVTSQSPATITDTTKRVKIKGEIQGWDDLPNCSVSFSIDVSR